MNLEELRNDIGLKQKKGLPFIIASVVIAPISIGRVGMQIMVFLGGFQGRNIYIVHQRSHLAKFGSRSSISGFPRRLVHSPSHFCKIYNVSWTWYEFR